VNDRKTQQSLDDICPQPSTPASDSRPLASPIYPASVYYCASTDQADALLTGTTEGYIYSREGHPNAEALARKCAQLHASDHAQICGSGMAAIALALLTELTAGDHVVISDQLYGRTTQLVTRELARLGVSSTVVDATSLEAVEAAMGSQTRLVLVETISNPLLRVVDVHRLAEIVHGRDAILLVDNTLASPAVCQPVALGADLVVESLTKLVNGHSDVLLGVLSGNTDSSAASARWDRIKTLSSIWGFAASPFECWLALRGAGTLALRADRSCDNAAEVAQWLETQRLDTQRLGGSNGVKDVLYPGLATHADHAIAREQFSRHRGYVVTFTLGGGREAVDRFIAASGEIPFCPSFGDLTTTLSHPGSTSHRGYTEAERAQLGIAPGMIRLSVGVESAATIISRLQTALRAVA
jgi:cystathionine beta-lyase/cystathionine gamma-synthase